MTDESLTPAELERFSRIPREDVAALVAEVRRLRGLFNEVDALRCEAVARHYESGDCGDLPDAEFVFPYRDLARRIRRAIGEPERTTPSAEELHNSGGASDE